MFWNIVCCFTLDVLDPWQLLALVGSLYNFMGLANKMLGWIGSGSWVSVGFHILAPVLKGSWGLPVE